MHILIPPQKFGLKYILYIAKYSSSYGLDPGRTENTLLLMEWIDNYSMPYFESYLLLNH